MHLLCDHNAPSVFFLLCPCRTTRWLSTAANSVKTISPWQRTRIAWCRRGEGVVLGWVGGEGCPPITVSAVSRWPSCTELLLQFLGKEPHHGKKKEKKKREGSWKNPLCSLLTIIWKNNEKANLIVHRILHVSLNLQLYRNLIQYLPMYSSKPFVQR